jgi:tetratricopeptide (TPR) repeat protein
MREALAACDMGAVMRAFRTHPLHGGDISQEVAAGWVGVTQPRLSKIENGDQLSNLNKLMRWAHVLRIPADLLWFRMPSALPPPDGVSATVQPDELPSTVVQQTRPVGCVLLPVVVGGRQVLVPLDATTVASSGLAELLDEQSATSDASGQDPATAVAWDAMSPLSRRSLLSRGLAVAALPGLGLDEAHHVALAMGDARRYFDGSVVDYLGRQLDACKADDGRLGPVKTLPMVLGILGAIGQSARDVKPDVRRQLVAVGACGAEFAGWLYRDASDPVRAAYWRDRATEWAQESGDTAMQGYVLLKKAQAAYDERDALRMLTLSQAVQTGPWQLPIRVRAEAAQQEARGHAMLGENNAMVERNLDQARQLLSDAADTSEQPLGAHYNSTLLTMQTAICHTEAGQPRRAAELYREWLSANKFSPRDYGYFLSLMASSLALAGEPDEAARTGLASVSLASGTDSGRTMQELAKVLSTLAPWKTRAAVRELQEAVSA